MLFPIDTREGKLSFFVFFLNVGFLAHKEIYLSEENVDLLIEESV